MANPTNVPGYEQPRIYGTDGKHSSIGPQLVDFYWHRKAIIETRPEMYFGQLASSRSMPKHMGKTIRQYHYIPFLDDRNINDQGIDATGRNIADEVTIVITDPAGYARYAVGQGIDATTALTAAQAKAEDIFKNLEMAVTAYAPAVATLTAAGWNITEGPAVNVGGNLYGSSKDVGTIKDKLPYLGEQGGRVNRVGFTRVTLEATIEKFGIFDEYTEDSMIFDSDPELMSHISRELMRGANEIVEDNIQIDLLNAANIVFYGGAAISTGTLTGETGSTPSELTYEMLLKLEQALNNTRCPKDTTIITGSRMIDTRTIGSTRYAYIGSEMKHTLLRMKDLHGEKAFIPIQQYGEAGKIANGEIGSVAGFRFIEVPKMLHWEGAGAPVTSNAGYLEGNGHYNVYPVLIVGSNSFATIGFQNDGTNSKFKIIHTPPGANAADRSDPYGTTGFYSMQWHYGFLALRPEWIACIKVVCHK